MGSLKWTAIVVTVVATALIVLGIAAFARVPGVVVAPEAAPAWTVRIALVDQALAEGSLSRAFFEWREAYRDAVRSGRWEALAAVGDAALRIDAVAGERSGFRAEARRVYLAALLRARARRSVAGVERIAEAFAKLGDAEMIEHARRIVARLS